MAAVQPLPVGERAEALFESWKDHFPTDDLRCEADAFWTTLIIHWQRWLIHQDASSLALVKHLSEVLKREERWLSNLHISPLIKFIYGREEEEGVLSLDGLHIRATFYELVYRNETTGELTGYPFCPNDESYSTRRHRPLLIAERAKQKCVPVGFSCETIFVGPSPTLKRLVRNLLWDPPRTVALCCLDKPLLSAPPLCLAEGECSISVYFNHRTIYTCDKRIFRLSALQEGLTEEQKVWLTKLHDNEHLWVDQLRICFFYGLPTFRAYQRRLLAQQVFQQEKKKATRTGAVIDKVVPPPQQSLHKDFKHLSMKESTFNFSAARRPHPKQKAKRVPVAPLSLHEEMCRESVRLLLCHATDEAFLSTYQARCQNSVPFGIRTQIAEDFHLMPVPYVLSHALRQSLPAAQEAAQKTLKKILEVKKMILYCGQGKQKTVAEFQRGTHTTFCSGLTLEGFQPSRPLCPRTLEVLRAWPSPLSPVRLLCDFLTDTRRFHQQHLQQHPECPMKLTEVLAEMKETFYSYLKGEMPTPLGFGALYRYCPLASARSLCTLYARRLYPFEDNPQFTTDVRNLLFFNNGPISTGCSALLFDDHDPILSVPEQPSVEAHLFPRLVYHFSWEDATVEAVQLLSKVAKAAAQHCQPLHILAEGVETELPLIHSKVEGLAVSVRWADGAWGDLHLGYTERGDCVTLFGTEPDREEHLSVLGSGLWLCSNLAHTWEEWLKVLAHHPGEKKVTCVVTLPFMEYL